MKIVNQNETEDLTIDLSEFFRVIRQNMLKIIFLSTLLATLAGCYTKFIMIPIYEAKTTLLLKYNASVADDNQTDANKELASFNLYRNLLKTYVDIANLSIVEERTAETLEVSPGQLDSIKSVVTNSSEDSQLITIVARGTEPEFLQDYLTTFGRTYQAFATENFGKDNLSILSEAVTTGKPVGPNLIRNSILGALLGLCLSIATILIRYLIADKIRSVEELENLMEVPVIGMIPQSGVNSKLKRPNSKLKK